MNAAFGVYFLANDAVAPWAEGMLRSLRVSNPDVPVIHIPFDGDCDRIRALCATYGATEFSGAVEEWDAIGTRFFPDNHVAAHAFRKFAIFGGPFDQFMFLDSDLAVIESLAPLASTIFDGAVDRICFYRHAHAARNYPIDSVREFIASAFPAWMPGGFNTALIAARRNIAFLEHVRRMARQADRLAPLLGVAYEQPFLNFCAMTFGLDPVRLPQLSADLSVNWDCYLDMRWREDGRGLITGSDSPDAANEALHGPGGAVAGKRVPLIHWGGYRTPGPDMPNHDVWLAAQCGAD